MKRLVIVGALSLAAALVAPPAGAAPAPTPVAGSGRGPDTLFPTQGNGGYDVSHYAVHLRYRPASGRLTARVGISAVASEPLSSFHLDLKGLQIRSIRVDDVPATWSRHGHELVITPAEPVSGAFTTRVRYAGVPKVHHDPDGSIEGLVPTSDGGTALNQPIGAVAWLPTDNYLGDKATWSFWIRAPRALKAAANGLLVGRQRHGATTTWHWEMPDPMPPELSTVTLGRYRVFRGTYTSITGRRIPLRSYIDPRFGRGRAARRLLHRVLAFEEHYFGPYPLASAGLTVDNAHVGYAIETMTRPFYTDIPAPGLIVHEMAHQWYGDSLTPRDWHDIWLNEGFATYAQWLWWGDHGGHDPAWHFAHLYAQPANAKLWQTPVRTFTDPADLFGVQSYNRGAMTLEALREKVGDAAFFTIIKAWATAHRGQTVTTPQFIALAERLSGQRLDGFFRTWLDVAGKPVGY